MLPAAHSSRVLEINLISAQDLAPLSKSSMKTYAVVWVHPERKLATGVDQRGDTNPTWNDRFSFRVDDKFLNDEDSAVIIEIYAAAWMKDALIGYIRVLISDLFTLHSAPQAKINNSAMRIVSLQIRRPSGRPQGILNMGVALLDSTMRSMPIYSEVSASSSLDYRDNPNQNNEIIQKSKKKNDKEKDKASRPKLLRAQSDRTDLTTEDYAKKADQGSVVNGGGSVVEAKGGSGSMVNGGSLCSDVGPSASVVAAAIAKGLYSVPVPDQQEVNKTESKILREWTRKEAAEDLSMKLERWRSELPPAHDRDYRKMKSGKNRHGRRKPDNGGLFSCFGNAFGLEISITCGGNSKNHRKRIGNGNKVCNLSSVDGQSSQSYV